MATRHVHTSLILAIQHYLRVLLSVKKSFAACVLSLHRTASKTWLEASCESVQQKYCGILDMQQVIMLLLLLVVHVFGAVYASSYFDRYAVYGFDK